MGSAAGRGQLEKDPTLWSTRAFALAGVAWVLYAMTVGALRFWKDVWDQWRDYYPELLRGYRNTIILSLVSFALAMALGAIVALTRTSDFLVLRFVSGAYIEWFRQHAAANPALLLVLRVAATGDCRSSGGRTGSCCLRGKRRSSGSRYTRAGLHGRGAAQRPALDRQGPDGGRALRGAELCPDARLRGCPPERFAWRSRCYETFQRALPE